MGLTLRFVEVDTGSSDHEGLLVYDDDRLLAILIRLSELHEGQEGTWHFEYGPSFQSRPGSFDSLDQATTWMNQARRPG